MTTTGTTFPTINLLKWIDEHPEAFTPPVMNKQFFHESQDAIIFVSKGPNTRNDFHVNATEELFYQLKGDIAVRVRPLDGSEPHNVIVREGETLLAIDPRGAVGAEVVVPDLHEVIMPDPAGGDLYLVTRRGAVSRFVSR